MTALSKILGILSCLTSSFASSLNLAVLTRCFARSFGIILDPCSSEANNGSGIDSHSLT